MRSLATRILNHPAFNVIGGLVGVYAGLGCLGIIGGWSGTQGIFAKLLGGTFLFSGTAALAQGIRSLRKRNPQAMGADELHSRHQ